MLGLFETPNTYAKDYPEFNSMASTFYNAAADGITLLKNNNNVLPLSKGAKTLRQVLMQLANVR